jgi:hypothetical protein
LARKLALALILSLCGITALAAEEGSPDLARPAPEIQDIAPPPIVTAPLSPDTEGTQAEIYPCEVQTIIDGDMRQIVKTYALTAKQSPTDIPRDGFERGGWQYSLADVTERRVTGTDVRTHTEPVTINTDTKDPGAVIGQLSPTLEYMDEDGYIGVLTLDISTVKCEEAGYRNTSYTITAMREYPHLSGPDLSLIPKTITENGRTLKLEDVSWEAQNTDNVDYDNLPSSYRAIAKYTAVASKTVVTGYVTTADYIGEIAKSVTGDTLYTVYFEGQEIKPDPEPTEPTDNPEAPDSQGGARTPALIAAGLAALTLVGGAVVFLLRRRNMKLSR